MMNAEDERRVREQYDADRELVRSLCNEAKSFVELLCARLSRGDFRLRLTEAHPKEVSSVLRKLDLKSVGPESLYDAVGDMIQLRVVVYNVSDVEEFQQAIQTADACPIEDLEFEPMDLATGYRGLHINGRLAGGPQRVGCEIQVRTALQDAWAVTSRADLYHPKAEVDSLWNVLAHAQADIVQAVDKVLQTIREGLEPPSVVVEKTQSEPTSEPEPPEPAEPPPPLDHVRMQQARQTLEKDEQFVLEQPISETRVEALRTDLLKLREMKGIKTLFRVVNAFERLHEYRADNRFGNRLLAWKGPFVEKSSWAGFFADEFHRSFENYLADRFAKQLDQDTQGSITHVQAWDDLPAFVEDAKKHISAKGGTADLVVITGHRNRKLFDLFDYRIPAQLGGQDAREIDGVIGVLDDLPTYNTWDDLKGERAYVMDLARSYRYVHTNPNPMNDEDLYMMVEVITNERAVDMVNERPDILQPKEGPRLTREEQVVRLQLQVILHLVEGGQVDTLSSDYIMGADLPPSDAD